MTMVFVDQNPAVCCLHPAHAIPLTAGQIVQVIVALEELSRDYPLDIPPYFALILRAFSVIEGTALRVDPDYAIVKETFPYLSRRLLTDNQPRARAALRQLLYGVRPLCTVCISILN